MKREQAINEISNIKTELEQGSPFSGRAAIIKACENRIRFLRMYKLEDKNCRLLVSECEKELVQANKTI